MVDFKELSDFCVKRYKESLDLEYQKYVKTLYVSISDDDEVKCSTAPHVLNDAYRCILIHVRSELAVSNWYAWYKLEYIDENGCVTDGKLGNGFRLATSFGQNYRDQKLNLVYDVDINNTTLIYSFSAPFEERMQKVWDLYCRVKNVKSQAELQMIIDLINKDDQIIELEGNIADLNFTNLLLEKQNKQYKRMFDEIKGLVKNS